MVKISFASCKGGKYFAFGILRTHANSTHHISLFKSARYFPETLQDITLEMVSERKWDKETRCHQNKLFLHSVISNFEDERLIKKNIYSFLCDNIVTCNAKAILSTWCPCLVLLLSFMLVLHLGKLKPENVSVLWVIYHEFFEKHLFFRLIFTRYLEGFLKYSWTLSYKMKLTMMPKYFHISSFDRSRSFRFIPSKTQLQWNVELFYTDGFCTVFFAILCRNALNNKTAKLEFSIFTFTGKDQQ